MKSLLFAVGLLLLGLSSESQAGMSDCEISLIPEKIKLLDSYTPRVFSNRSKIAITLSENAASGRRIINHSELVIPNEAIGLWLSKGFRNQSQKPRIENFGNVFVDVKADNRIFSPSGTLLSQMIPVRAIMEARYSYISTSSGEGDEMYQIYGSVLEFSNDIVDLRVKAYARCLN